MKFTTTFLFVLSLFPSAAAVAAPEAPQLVQSMPAPHESRRTLAIAPASGVSRTVANYAAAQLSPLVAGTKVYTVAPTGSMRPLFDANSVLLAEPAPFDSLQVGDIVIFRHSRTGVMVVHRILERKREGYWTMGDHNDRMDDDLVTAKNYAGRIYGILYTTRSDKGLKSRGAEGAAGLMASAQ